MSVEKVAVVTGSNKGIGYAIAKGLCEKFIGIVYITARDPSRGETAVANLKKLGFNPCFHQLDITDNDSIETFKNHLESKHGGIDVLINNAAIAFKVEATEPFTEQAETTIAVNYFATLMLCESLFPILRRNARVVNVSSSAGHLSVISSADVKAQLIDSTLTVTKLNKLVEQFIDDVRQDRYKDVWSNSAYRISKVFLNALTQIQQRQFNEETPSRNISINAVHPGYVDTDMSSHKGHLTIEEGAVAPLWLALDASADVKGKFVWNDTKIVDWTVEKFPHYY